MTGGDAGHDHRHTPDALLCQDISCVSVCRAKVLAILKDERSLPRQLPVQRVAPSGARPGDRRVQVHWVKPSVREDGTVANRRAVTTVNP